MRATILEKICLPKGYEVTFLYSDMTLLGFVGVIFKLALCSELVLWSDEINIVVTLGEVLDTLFHRSFAWRQV
ncbi:hypothetical protein GCM10009410_10430 [Shewanella ulleungensis]|uniref:Uncharacterized protein n=1 Tax=Shewanella ulleungensis TaxID=2282699 RepID=A0ABQ2QH69_9GAMM|nr:hypothetical protein GCM10009410_10430 [Shewanella ulleungensis]